MAGSESPKAAVADSSTEIEVLRRGVIGLYNAMRLRVREGLLARGHDLTPSHTHLIPNLPREGCRLTDLAARLNLTLQRTGQLVQELEEVGYVEKLPDERDGRAKRVVYTRRGLALIADSDEIQRAAAAEYAEILGKEKLQLLSALLGQLVEGLELAEDVDER